MAIGAPRTGRCDTSLESKQPLVELSGHRVVAVDFDVAAPIRSAFLLGREGEEPVGVHVVEAAGEWPACPVETTLALIGDKWKPLILRDLLTGTKRFGELQRSVGHVSQKVLTSQLRAMEADGLVHREVFAEVPPRVEYSLTPLGRSLEPVIDALKVWGEGFKAGLDAAK